MYKGVEIIAEVKTKSPFGWSSDKTWGELLLIAEPVADILSIHTDSRWGGSFDLIKKAKKLSSKPILAKGVHASDEEVRKAIEAGADYVLVLGRIPQVHQKQCLIEPLSLEELQHIPESYKIVWNSRDLETGGLKQEIFAEARNIFPGWLCQASNIKTVDDIEAGADAVLVGTNIQEFGDSLKSH